MRSLPLFLLVLGGAPSMQGESGHDAWLRYSHIDDPRIRAAYDRLPSAVFAPGHSPAIASAREELVRGIRSMLGRTLRFESKLPQEDAIVLGTFAELHERSGLKPDGFRIQTRAEGNRRLVVITGDNDRGVLYGTFAVLRRIALHQPVLDVEIEEEPYAPVRWINQWDNLDGSIERGYGGRSIFFEQNDVRADLGPVRDYARLLASVGVNGCAINNVNANPRVITADFLPQLARIAEVFRGWGVRLAVSVDFSSPQRIGGLDTFDPLDPRVAAWWRAKVDEVYRAVPDLGGFVLKADSEGRVGPSAYGRTHADAANVIANALKRQGGLIFYRGFVYDHHMDWRNLKNDRARAAYDNFVNLDGRFADNVLVQIKHGPIDFQVREPVSPLFGALEKTNEAVELQITQEYFGQARHVVFLVPMWKDALDFDLHARGGGTRVKALAAGKIFARPQGAFVGVANAGLDANWLGNHLSQANLYGFGRLAWNPDLTSKQIVEEWTRLTFSDDPLVVQTVGDIQLSSWRTYEKYTGPLGLQTLTDIVGNHFGVAVEASERNGWGQWHRSDNKGAGMDRSMATGTGYIGQYHREVAEMFESLSSCPDDLLLFMHHVPYTHVLHSGKTVIQYIYDAHYDGAAAAAQYVREWRALKSKIDEQRFHDVLSTLEYQAGSAEQWRDAVNTWFLKTSGIPDRTGRAGHFPGRYEAESLELSGYVPTNIKPWEAASGAKAVRCEAARCSASLRFDGKSGWYTLNIRYFDQIDGVSHFRLWLGAQLIDEWAADDHLPTRKLDSSSSTRRLIQAVPLRTGDEIRIEGEPGGNEPAALDYLEVVPASRT